MHLLYPEQANDQLVWEAELVLIYRPFIGHESLNRSTPRLSGVLTSPSLSEDDRGEEEEEGATGEAKIPIDNIWLACYFSSRNAISRVIPGTFFFFPIFISFVNQTFREHPITAPLHHSLFPVFVLWKEAWRVKISFCFWRKSWIVCVFNLLLWGDWLWQFGIWEYNTAT